MIEERVDGGIEARLRELWEMPVGRRWLLKAGLGSAAAVGAQLYAGPAMAAAQHLRHEVSTGELQFALGSLPGVTDLTLVANGQRLPLRSHTRTSRAALRQRGGLWRRVDLSALSHYVSGVELPDHRTMLVSVHGRRGSHDVVVSQLWNVPPSATIALATVAHRLTGTVAEAMGVSGRLGRLGTGSIGSLSPADVALVDTIGDSDQAAIALTSVHPNIATIAPTEARVTIALLGNTPEVRTLGKEITRFQNAGKDYMTRVPAVNPDGKPSEIVFTPKDRSPLKTTFETITLNPDRGFNDALKASVSAGIRGVRDNDELGAVIDEPLVLDKAASTRTWVQPAGVAPRATPISRALEGSAIDVKVKNTGLNSGTYVTVDGDFVGGKVPLRLYNNYVRWVSVYVQYLGKDGTNLSVNPKPTEADTKYSQYLGMMPQVFTVLGVPIWDTNTIGVTLTFPPGSHVARLLLCGLGSNNEDGGWRQYFPEDAYSGVIAPTGEVLVPSLLTGILTIGLTVFALATDFDVALAWSKVRTEVQKVIDSDAGLLDSIFNSLLRGAGVQLTAAETASLATAAGADEVGDTGKGLWRTLENLASVIPKVLFGPASAAFFLKIAADLLEVEAAEKLLDAIPIIGQVLAVIAVLGDVATLAEVCAETIVSPWVIENEVSLTYRATVTISRDPRSSTWPVTARSWQLEALVDGALTLDPIIGSINDGGKSYSEPLKLDVTAPFGGKRIQWSFVALDASGRQVATGVSGTFTNDDPATPAKEVKFEIEQLPATITSSTVFKRAATTTYDTKAGGYSWSDRVAVTGTIQADHAQDLAGVAVATLAGVAGMVFKQNGQYYLRGVPLAQDGATIELGVAPTEGYARRPFVLLDAFVDKADRGNHVLLEPDDTSDVYHVRRLSLDPATGALSWERGVSYGTFVLPVSRAALHSSGRVVVVHTNSGRLGSLQPVRTPRPLLATYSAGPGTRIGLLSSPVAVAITNPGVVLVLEAGTSQLAAFDLNGNPVRYFSRFAGARRSFTRPLASKGTPLDLAVDGAGQIYILYFTGSGSDPADYHVDVYKQSGDVLDTHSPGVNVGRLAVDYWRSIYGANYDALTDLGTTKPRIDPRLQVVEPSLSRFDPTEQALSGAPVEHRHRHPRFRG